MFKRVVLAVGMLAGALAGCGGGGGGATPGSVALAPTAGPDETAQASGLVLAVAPLGASSTARVACAETQAVSVETLGARPDDGVDDTAVLQQAINMAPAGTTFVFPAGVYQISAMLLPRSDLTLCASSTATLRWTGGSGHLIDAAYRGRADRFNLYNLVFDGASVILAGSGNRVVNNTFRNVNRPGTALESDHTRMHALHIVGFEDGVIEHNVFDNIDTNTALIGHGVSGSVIRNNSMGRVYQAMHFFEITGTEVAQNRLSGMRRMGIEVQGSNLRGLVIRDNVLSDWRFEADQRELIGMSVVSGDSVVIQGNVLRCGAGCDNSERGWGMELGGAGTLAVQRNVVQGFAIGLGVAILDSVTLDGNAVYDSHAAIYKFNNGPVSGSMRVTGNHIENARDCGICGEWSLIRAPVLSGNTVAREAGRWAGDAGRRYVGIIASPVTSGAAAMQIQGNRLLLEGSAAAGLHGWGVCLCGVNGNLSGLTLSGNWFGGSGGDWGGGVLINAERAAGGVRFASNQFQNMAMAVAGVHTWLAGGFTASGNTAFNVPTAGLWPGVVDASARVDLPRLGLTASASGSQRTLQLSGLAGGINATWLFGDGLSATSTATGIRHLYAVNGGQTMRARAWVGHASGAWLTASAALPFTAPTP